MSHVLCSDVCGKYADLSTDMENLHLSRAGQFPSLWVRTFAFEMMAISTAATKCPPVRTSLIPLKSNLEITFNRWENGTVRFLLLNFVWYTAFSLLWETWISRKKYIWETAFATTKLAHAHPRLSQIIKYYRTSDLTKFHAKFNIVIAGGGLNLWKTCI